MATRAPARLEPDRQRIRELARRELAALNDRTHASEALFRRAGRVLPGGVASSFQLRDPWPVYMTRGEGSRVWDADGNEYVDLHNGFGAMLQGHAHPAITAAVQARAARGTHFGALSEDLQPGGRRLDGRRARAGQLRGLRRAARGRGAGGPAAGPRAAGSERGPAGSCIAVVATDAPLDSAALSRLARRAGLGLARTGSVAHHASGEIFVAFSTSRATKAIDMDPLFAATVDATEEAVLNCLWSAETTTGREGRVSRRCRTTRSWGCSSRTAACALDSLGGPRLLGFPWGLGYPNPARIKPLL